MNMWVCSGCGEHNVCIRKFCSVCKMPRQKDKDKVIFQRKKESKQ